MAQSKEVFARAKQLQGQPVCITLHNGKTYVGYITDANSSVLTLASASAQPSTSSGKQGSRRSMQGSSGSRASGSRRGGSRKPSVRSRSRKSSARPRSRKPDVQVSAFLPIIGSLFGGLGGIGGLGGAATGSLGGALGGGMRLFGMIQRFVPVMKMGYGMIKSIRPFLGAVQGLMTPSGAVGATSESQ
jgi:predicted lipid-binding transport protein (Tim44 family)